MRTAIGFGLVLFLTTAPAMAQDDQKGQGDLNGTYTYVSGMEGQEAVDKDHLGGTVRITDDRIALLGKDGEENYVIEYKVDEKQEGGVCRVSMKIVRSTAQEAEGSAAKGLFKAEGDDLTIIYNVGGADYPKDFNPTRETQHKFVLKRQGGR